MGAQWLEGDKDDVVVVDDTHFPVLIATWLGALPRTPQEGELRILLSPRANMSFSALPTEPPQGRVPVLIGPEGGLSAVEEAAATAYGFAVIGVGPRVLRTETAGIAVLAALAARWGGW